MYYYQSCNSIVVTILLTPYNITPSNISPTLQQQYHTILLTPYNITPSNISPTLQQQYHTILLTPYNITPSNISPTLQQQYHTILLTKITAVQNEVALSCHRVRGLYLCARLVVIECAGYIFWQLFLQWLKVILSHTMCIVYYDTVVRF